ncbi:MAG: NAD(P)(+) transhydrogenase (Re/Si-specific) subunit beta [Bacteroidales bacterium]|nr:NAD(P)(+) transhydrogenase (Re/Si-specific) subunit beta [Candidatus Cacconaster merdequi]
MFGLATITFQLILVGVFAVATIVGYLLINKVPPTLHTPLMSGMNALSGVTVLGAMTATAAGFYGDTPAGRITVSILGALAVALAMVNVAGGFAVTDRMLSMIAKNRAKGQCAIYTALVVAACAILAVIFCFTKFSTSGIHTAYIILSAVLSCGILGGIALMSKIAYSKIGNRISAVCMLIAIILTVVYSGGNVFTGNSICAVWPVFAGLAAGLITGLVLAAKVSMLQMPQMVALFNGLGGGASALVGAFAMFGIGAGLGYFEKTTASLAFAIGMVTLLGSLVAAGKLHRILPQKPVIIKNHGFRQIASAITMIAAIVIYIIFASAEVSDQTAMIIDFIAIALSAITFGLLFSLKVGGADMPITISLLNSLSGVAGAIAGLAIGDLLLVAVGGIVGASGLLLTQIMCKAMNRSLVAILSGKTTAAPAPEATAAQPAPEAPAAECVEAEEEIKEEIAPEPEAETAPAVEENPAPKLKGAKEVIIVPGYGMAIAQAQHTVKRLADKLVAGGTKVKYAVHPVAGRMPGHMNVLLCEADVDYEDLYEMDNINPEFKDADATIVIGANDVTNPAASTAVGTPIYGMPVLNVNDCKNIFVFNFDLKPGYAGVENPIYTRKEGVHLYLGNAAETLAKFIEDMDR